jgi:hypothetical protein
MLMLVLLLVLLLVLMLWRLTQLTCVAKCDCATQRKVVAKTIVLASFASFVWCSDGSHLFTIGRWYGPDGFAITKPHVCAQFVPRQCRTLTNINNGQTGESNNLATSP